MISPLGPSPIISTLLPGLTFAAFMARALAETSSRTGASVLPIESGTIVNIRVGAVAYRRCFNLYHFVCLWTGRGDRGLVRF